MINAIADVLGHPGKNFMREDVEWTLNERRSWKPVEMLICENVARWGVVTLDQVLKALCGTEVFLQTPKRLARVVELLHARPRCRVTGQYRMPLR